MRYCLIAFLLMTMTAKELLATRKSPEEKQAIIQLARKELALQKEINPLRFYEPNGAIEKVINEVGSNDGKWIFVLAAANKVGKTSGTLNILGNIIYGPQSEWFEQPRFKNWKHPKRFWYVSEHETLKNVVTGTDGVNGEIIKWFPKDRYTMKKGSRDFYSEFSADNGWTGKFMTYDQDIQQFESDNIGVLIFDEPAPRPIYNAGLARLLAGGGIVMMPMTPLSGSAWVFDELINKSSTDSPVYVLYADIEAACKQHGVRGYIEHGNIQKIVEQYDEEEKEARAHGKPTHLKGLVYKNIHPSKHRHDIPADKFTQDKYLIYQVVDPHDSRPPFVEWYAVDPYDNTFAIAEYPEEVFHTMKSFKLTTKEVCEKLMLMEKGFGWDDKKIIRIMDPNFGRKQNQTVGKTTAQWWAWIGQEIGWNMYYSTNVNDDLKAGHTAVREMLALTRDGEAKFKVGMQCPNLWLSINRYSYLPRTGKGLEAHGEGDAVAEKFKDGADTLRYLKMVVYAPAEPKEAKVYSSYDQYAHETIFEKIKKRNTSDRVRNDAL